MNKKNKIIHKTLTSIFTYCHFFKSQNTKEAKRAAIKVASLLARHITKRTNETAWCISKSPKKRIGVSLRFSFLNLPIILWCVLVKVFAIALAFQEFAFIMKYSRFSLSRSRRDPLKHFEVSVLRHIRFAELRKIPIELPQMNM